MLGNPERVTMRCPVCNAVNPPESQRCQTCGEELPPSGTTGGPPDEVLALPADAVAVESADEPAPRPEKDKDVDIVRIFIPYENPRSLAAYYISIFALIPGIGFVLGPLAIWLGIAGVRYANANPQAKGMVHAITGIVLGVVALFCWNPFWCLLLIVTYFYLP
jgi:hypothetical protein